MKAATTIIQEAGGHDGAVHVTRFVEVLELAQINVRDGYGDLDIMSNFLYGALLMTGVEDWGTAWEVAEETAYTMKEAYANEMKEEDL